MGGTPPPPPQKKKRKKKCYLEPPPFPCRARDHATTSQLHGINIFDASTTPNTRTLTLPLTATSNSGTRMISSVKESSALPPKLVQRIQDLEYVEMSELVPDAWRFQEDEQKCCHQIRRIPRRGPVTDILLWVECYALLVSVLATKFPEKIPQLMAYQQTIVKAHRTFIGEGWVTYDACFRRKASFTKSLEWGMVDFTLYNETFTGRAKSITRCRYCLSEHHSSSTCVYAPDTPANRDSSNSKVTPRTMRKICLLYNSQAGNRCRYNPCRYIHSCTECQGAHPKSTCPRTRPPAAKRARSPSPYRPKK